MSELLFWFEKVANQHLAAEGTYGNLFVFDDCCIWSHPRRSTLKEELFGLDLGALGEEQAKLTGDDLRTNLSDHSSSGDRTRMTIATNDFVRTV
jgi:hypothetical protein